MIFVEGYDVRPARTITAVTTPPGKAVGMYGAVLFKVSGGARTPVKSWSSTELESGLANFTMDLTAPERYELVLAAIVTAATTLATVMRFDPHPPADDPHTLTLNPSEGIPQRLWVFFPF